MRKPSSFAVALALGVAAAGMYGQTAKSPATLSGAAYTLSDGASTANTASQLLTDLARTAKADEPLKNDFIAYGTVGSDEWEGFAADVENVSEDVTHASADVQELSEYRNTQPVERYLTSENYRQSSKRIRDLQATWTGYEEAVKKADRWIEQVNEREWMRKGCSACAASIPAADTAKRERTERSLVRELGGGDGSSGGLLAATAGTLRRVASEFSAVEAEVAALERKEGAHSSTIGAKQMATMIGIGGFTTTQPGAQK